MDGKTLTPSRKFKTSKKTSRESPEKRSPGAYSFSLNRSPGEDCTRHFDDMPFVLKGCEIKKSLRWGHVGFSCVSARYQIPYISKTGHFTGCSIASVRCPASTYVATVVSTILNRINYHNLKHNKGHKKAPPGLLSGVAFVYALTKSKWFLDRVLYLLKRYEKNKKILGALLCKFRSQFDDHTRFVYSQVKFQTHWLLFRGVSPRDKSKFKMSRSEDSSIFNVGNPELGFVRSAAFRSVSYKIHSVSQ